MSPRVGIVVPAYNAERFLARALESVLAQGERRWACVVVDDGSQDGTVEVARGFAERDERFQVVLQPRNAGVSRARVAGAATLPPSEFVIFLDADDVWHADALERLLAAMDRRRNRRAPAAHGLARFIDAAGSPLESDALAARLRRLEWRVNAIVEPMPAEPTSARMLSTWPCVITPGVVLVRRGAWIASGGFNARLSIGEDWELWYRLSLRAPLAFVAEPLIDFRVYDTSSSSSWKRPFKLARARALVLAAGTRDDQRYARRASRAMSRQLGWGRLREGVASLRRLRLASGGKSVLGGAANLLMSLRP